MKAQITYAVGDIHGELTLLEAVLAAIECDAARLGSSAKVVFLGDYVDKGPDSFGVVERIRRGPTRKGDVWIAIKGNHDDSLVACFREWPRRVKWAERSMRETLESYGTDVVELVETRLRTMPPDLRRHLSFLDSLPLYHDDGVRLFVHAGVRPYLRIEQQSHNDLMWIRDDFTGHAGPFDRTVVHGHSVCGSLPQLLANRICLDTGACYSKRLTFAAFGPGSPRFFQTEMAADGLAVVPVEPSVGAAARLQPQLA
jgi:serine/threonine protein phosphatase 1